MLQNIFESLFGYIVYIVIIGIAAWRWTHFIPEAKNEVIAPYEWADWSDEEDCLTGKRNPNKQTWRVVNFRAGIAGPAQCRRFGEHLCSRHSGRTTGAGPEYDADPGNSAGTARSCGPSSYDSRTGPRGGAEVT